MDHSCTCILGVFPIMCRNKLGIFEIFRQWNIILASRYGKTCRYVKICNLLRFYLPVVYIAVIVYSSQKYAIKWQVLVLSKQRRFLRQPVQFEFNWRLKFIKHAFFIGSKRWEFVEWVKQVKILIKQSLVSKSQWGRSACWIGATVHN